MWKYCLSHCFVIDPRFRGDDNSGYKFPLEFTPHLMQGGNDKVSRKEIEEKL